MKRQLCNHRLSFVVTTWWSSQHLSAFLSSKLQIFLSNITEIVVYSKVSGISVEYTAKYMAPFGTIEILLIPSRMKVPQKVLTQTQNLRNSMELEIDTQKVPQTPSRGNFHGFVSVGFPWKFHRFDLISWRMYDNSTRLHVT